MVSLDHLPPQSTAPSNSNSSTSLQTAVQHDTVYTMSYAAHYQFMMLLRASR
jgi:hypothetical protein